MEGHLAADRSRACESDGMEHSLALGVGAFAALVAAALVISIAAERIRIPAPVLLVAFGVCAGTIWHIRPGFEFGPALLFVFLPPLIFEAAWSIDLRELTANWLRIVLLAFPGTLFVAFAIAGALTGFGALSFASALLLGAIVSATDPVAVVSVFRRVPVPPALRTIVEAESLSNDGIAVVLYSVALAAATGAAISWTGAIGTGALAILGGIAIGAACAVPLWWALAATEASEYEVAATVALAYIAYILADSVHCSGIFATASAAVVLRTLLTRNARMSNRNDVDAFWNTAAYIANAVVFVATGLVIDPIRVLHEPLLVIVALAVILGSRVVLAWFIASDMRSRLTVFMAGMRGALPLALALALPETLADRAQIIDVVFATVLVTLVLGGIPLPFLAQRLYGTQRHPSSADN
jgi:CPA1 family monovalent cation:H+ antiporter